MTNQPSRLGFIFWILVTLSLRCIPFQTTLAADLHMKIDDVKFDNGAVVRFLETSSTQTTVPSETLKKMIAGQPDDKRFTVFTTVDEITAYPSFENYIFYVRSASAAEVPVIRFTVQAVPYDSFADQVRVLRIHLLDGTMDRSVEMSLPVHSLKSGNYLWAKTNAVAKVHLSGDTISIDLVNKYLLPVKITDATIEPDSPSHWLPKTELQKVLPIILGSDENNNHVALVWKVQPRALGVLRDSLIPVSSAVTGEGSSDSKADSEQNVAAVDHLVISIHYVPEQGGFDHPIRVSRSIFFYPSVPALVGVSVLGAVVGGIIMFFGFRKDTGLRKFLNYLAPNIVLALFIQFIAIVLFSFDNSKVQIGVVNLNPTLLIPAGCLGAISVLYGFQLIERFLGKAGAGSGNATPGGAA